MTPRRDIPLRGYPMGTTGRAIEGEAPGSWGRGDSAWLLVIGLVALGLRLGYVLEYAGHPIGRMP